MTNIVEVRVKPCGRNEVIYLNEEQVEKLEKGESLDFGYECGDKVTIRKKGDSLFTFEREEPSPECLDILQFRYDEAKRYLGKLRGN